MKMEIRDIPTLRSIRPLDIAVYLRSKEWIESRVQVNQFSIWKNQNRELGDYEILLPLNYEVQDYAIRMSELLNILEKFENRSQIDILTDLQNSSSDVIRLHFDIPDSLEGTVPIEKGVGIFQQARDMMMAAACSTINPRQIFQSRPPNQARDYLNKVRLGQTERGSYIVTLLSRVSPELHVGQTNLQGLEEPEEPFERKVTINLAKALHSMKQAAERSAIEGTLEYFERAVSQGVSANLCDVVAKMGSFNDQFRDLHVNIAWSKTRPITETIDSNIILSADFMPVFEEVARVFKESAPREDFEVKGPVVRLERPDGALTGKVTILTFIDEQPRKITIELPEEQYHITVQAHDQQQTISCKGQLTREGGRYLLKNARELEIERE